jgi:hypothetical protein
MTHSRSISAVLLCVGLVACNENPAEVRSSAEAFPIRATWSGSAAPISPSTVTATLTAKQFAGFRIETAVTITGAPNTAYQWRIFRGDCATTAVAATAAASGLFLFATAESYPNVTTNASGTGTATRVIAGSLDSLKAYSVRVRVSQTATNWPGTSPVACGNLQRSPGG